MDFFIEEQIPEIDPAIFMEAKDSDSFIAGIIDSIKSIIFAMQNTLSKLKNMITNVSFKTKMKLKAKVLKKRVESGDVVRIPDFKRIYDLYENECYQLTKSFQKLNKRGRKIKTEFDLADYENACKDFEDEIDACAKKITEIMHKKIPVMNNLSNFKIIEDLAQGKCAAFNLYADVIRNIDDMTADYSKMVKEADMKAHRRISARHKKAMSLHVGCARKLGASLNTGLKRCVFVVASL